MIEVVAISSERLDQYANLLQGVFRKHFLTQEYLNWQYFQNPNGYAVGFDAISEGSVVAHYACIPLRLWGTDEPILLSLNTATNPQFQGKGLFKKLAQATYEHASKSFIAVVGVANKNSFPGFVRSLGFIQLGNLDLRIGPLSLPARSPQEVQYTPDFLNWRTSSPRGGFSMKEAGDGVVVKRQVSRFAPPLRAFIPHLGYVENIDSKRPIETKLTMTLDWTSSGIRSRGVSMPQRLKPSPLHLIYRNLQGDSSTVTTPLTRFTFLDFDAF